MLRYIILGMDPLATVENPWFVELLAHFQPLYDTPTRPHITKLIQPKVDRVAECLRLHLLKTAAVSFTTDIWTNEFTKDSFMSLSTHWIDEMWQRWDFTIECAHTQGRHTGEHIADCIHQALSKWGLLHTNENAASASASMSTASSTTATVNSTIPPPPSPPTPPLPVLQTMVRDGASTMRIGCDMLTEKNVPLLSHQHCLIHLLQLVVTDAVLERGEARKVIAKCREMCRFVHSSARATGTLRKKQMELGAIPLSKTKQLVGDVKTRWNSTYLMLRRIMLLRGSIEEWQTLEADLPSTISKWSHVKCLKPNDWAVLNNIILVLEPFFRYTEIMSSNKMTNGVAILLIYTLYKDLQSVSEHFVTNMKAELLKEMTRRFFSKNPSEVTGPNKVVEYNIYTDERFTVPCLLNPVTKLMAITGDFSDKRKALDDFRNALTKIGIEMELKKKQEEARM